MTERPPLSAAVAASVVPDAGRVDGRIARRHRNRDAVLAAYVEMVEEGVVEPHIEAVAARAGVSQRSVFRYFTNREELVRAAMISVVGRAESNFDLAGLAAAPVAERVDALVRGRWRLYRSMGRLARAAMRAAETDPLIAEMVEVGQAMLRAQFVDLFGPELRHLDGGAQLRAVAMATLPLQVDSFVFLDRSLGGADELIVAELRDQVLLTLGRFAESAID